jgi:hypothetical protein
MFVLKVKRISYLQVLNRYGVVSERIINILIFKILYENTSESNLAR